MKSTSEKRIFARVDPTDFVGRLSHVERLTELSKSTGGLVFLATPQAGASEILRHTYDLLFHQQHDVIPFYFEVRENDLTAQNMAMRFLCEFMLQTVAFRRGDPTIIDSAPELAEIADLAVPSDGYWIDRLVDNIFGDGRSNQSRSWIRNCLSSPLRAAANGAKSFVMIDNFHAARELDGGNALFEDICEIFGRGGVPFVLGGHRRALYAATTLETMAVEAFSFSDAGHLVERRAATLGVEINDQTRDLIAVQLAGNAGHISHLLISAAANAVELNTFENVEKVYTDEIFGGRICRDLDTVFDRVVPDDYAQERVLWLLRENMRAADGRVPTSYWKRHATRSGVDLDSVLSLFNHHEIVSVGSGSVDVDVSNVVLCDYLRGRGRLEIDREPRSLTVGEALAENVKRAPTLMARFYRQTAAIDLRSLLSAFDGSRISPAFIDYARFKEEFKGAGDEKILKSLKEDTETFELPQVVYVASTASFYPVLNELCDPERSATALGFGGKDEVAWLAAQLDSKLEATRELAEFWCDRLEMAAVNAEFDNFKLWLIAPEGFSPDAVEMLAQRGAYGSSRKQIDLLSVALNADISPSQKANADEYEIVVPMGEDTEMIAAHTVEDIAKRHHFPAKAINQIKTALVEACINASEHSLSPDRRIHQKFSVEPDKITITVTNRGLRLADKPESQPNMDESRRGWGLKLMKGLMDDVRIERTDDGTKITMVKQIERSVAADADAP